MTDVQEDDVEIIDSTVWEYLSDIVIPEKYLTDDLDKPTIEFMQQLYDECSNFDVTEGDETEEIEVDEDMYIEHLEVTVRMLNRQRSLLLYLLNAKHHTSFSGNIKDQTWWKDELCSKMIFYAFTGRLPINLNRASQKFWTVKDFEEAMEIRKLLPSELKERAAEFIEIYASGFFETEAKTFDPYVQPVELSNV